MKVPERSDKPLSMDGKVKFSDRLKALLKTESRQDVDPYIFSEPEPFTNSGGKNIRLIATENALKTPRRSSKNHKSKRKHENNSISIDTNCKIPSSRRVIPLDTVDSNMAKSLGINYYSRPDRQGKQRHFDNLQRLRSRRQSRDHTLLYYPRAGDEISDSDSSGDELLLYQRHWFSGERELSLNRSARLLQVRCQLRRRLQQLHKGGGPEMKTALQDRTRCLLEAALRDPTSAARALSNTRSTSSRGMVTDGPLIVGGPCGATGCQQTSLPCTRHCSRHIMLNGDQLLFEHCTAKFSDNTQCCIPVFDVAHELPLCPEHARKRDNYHRKAQESKPKKARKKPVSPTITSRPKPKSRPKKRSSGSSKRPVSNPSSSSNKLHDSVNVLSSLPPPLVSSQHEEPNNPFVNSECIASNENHTKTLNNLNTAPVSQSSTSSSTNLNNLGLGLGALGLGANALKVELSDHEVFASLDPTEHDFGNVLNNLPADAFNDLFIENRNGEYGPSREEEEELERALEAVDKDVRNLERMEQTHGLLEPALLAQLMSDIAS